MAGTMLAAGAVVVAGLLTAGLAAAGGAALTSQRAAAAADGAALAAADVASGALAPPDGAESPCDAAAVIAARHAAALIGCVVEGATVTVSASVDFGPVAAVATARAGPPPREAVLTAIARLRARRTRVDNVLIAPPASP